MQSQSALLENAIPILIYHFFVFKFILIMLLTV